MNQETKTSLPGYKDIIQEIGKQLRARKKDFLKRIILISWPVPTIFAIFRLKNYLSEKNILTLPEKYDLWFFVIIGALVILVIFYYYILSAIFAIEKIVWIDSYFDNKNLDSKTSWKIAQKLLPSATMLVSMTFLRFYLWIPLFYGSLFYFYFYYFLQFNISDSVGNAMGIIIIFLLFFIPIYFYYLRIKLRFLWFVFLDLYGQEGVLATEVFQEMKKLNQIRKSDMFKKTLIINLGSDAIGIIVQQVIENLQKGFNSLGVGSQVLGLYMRSFAEETNKQITSFGKMTGVYLLYRYARQSLYGEAQKVNENIYKID